MAVLPESMDRLNVEDTAGSLSVIENYIRYMGERIEFSISNMGKTFAGMGTSSAEMYLLLAAATNEISSLKSTVNGIAGDVTAMKNTVAGINEEIADIKSSVEALDERVSALEDQE